MLHQIIATLSGEDPLTLGITASTGIAATNIGGTTLHSWAGIKLGKESAKRMAEKIIYQKTLETVLERWRTVQSLIIDEGAKSRQISQLIKHF